jgi:hypothetical protein
LALAEICQCQTFGQRPWQAHGMSKISHT